MPLYYLNVLDEYVLVPRVMGCQLTIQPNGKLDQGNIVGWGVAASVIHGILGIICRSTGDGDCHTVEQGPDRLPTYRTPYSNSLFLALNL